MNSSAATRFFKKLVIVGAVGCFGSALGGSVTYTGPNFGMWNSPTSWSNGVVPGTGEDVRILNASSADLWVNGNTSYKGPGISSLLINGSGAAEAIADISKNLVVSDSTALGSFGTGAIKQSGGDQSHGLLVLGASQPNDVGIFALEKGKLSAGDILVGGAGVGVFNHAKGDVNVVHNLTVGKSTSNDSIYRMINGNLKVGGLTVIGGAGDGFYEQTKGTAILGALSVGNDAGGIGSVRQFGGTVRAGSVTVGKAGTGYYAISAGVHSVTGNLSLGASTEGEGFYEIRGGTLDVGGKVLVGGEGKGGFFQTGANANIRGGVEVRAGEYHLQNATLATRGLSVAAGGKFTAGGTKSIVRTSGDIVFNSAANIQTRDATLSVAQGSHISLSAIQADSGASFAALSGEESWNGITLEKNVTLSLQGTAGAALYVNSLNIGSTDPFRVGSIITGNGVDMYYNALSKANKYLKSGTYDFLNGGQLIPVYGNGSSGGSTGAVLTFDGGGHVVSPVLTGTFSGPGSLVLPLGTLANTTLQQGGNERRIEDGLSRSLGAVPEPSSLALILLASAALFNRRRRKWH